MNCLARWHDQLSDVQPGFVAPETLLPGGNDCRVPHLLVGRGVSGAFDAVLQLSVNSEINSSPVI